MGDTLRHQVKINANSGLVVGMWT